MSIKYYDNEKVFKLDSKNTSYLIGLADDRYVGHMYFGKKIEDYNLKYLIGTHRNHYVPSENKREKVIFSDTFAWEYGFPGFGDFHEHCIEIEKDKNQSVGLELLYKDYKIYNGKKKPEGLPATFASEEECQTLEMILEDSFMGIEVTMIYNVFKELDVITRSTKVTNKNDEAIALKRIFSACVDLHEGEYDLLTLYGAWGSERGICRRDIGFGKQSISSVRGVSSHQENPFMAIMHKGTTEDAGEVYGFNFVYSGNYFAQAERNVSSRVRVVMGINPYQFSWKLEQDESFISPEVVMVHSDKGLGGMTRTFHDLYRKHLIRGKYADKKRPILINNWEATYFDFTSEKLLDIAKEAACLGIEMLVMDDGWFGKRKDDNSSLGDWYVNEEKLSGGLHYLVSKVNELGMKFGIWMEPEMVSPDSDLYREHPDWILMQQGREGSLSRNQYVLDFTRKEVRDTIYSKIYQILKSANISYVKWDMNRALTNVASNALDGERQGEVFHRYVLGVYELQNRLTEDFPDLLLENCSSGGGRYDPGMLYYSPQIWCSDDTDAIERLEIQRGTAMVYPLSTMGAHVSDCPNHITHRITPFKTRGIVALSGTFGYELDVTKLSQVEKDLVKEQVKMYHKYNDLIREGDYYRISSLEDGNHYDCYMVVSKDKKEAYVSFVRELNHLRKGRQLIKLKGLSEQYIYQIENSGEKYHGSTFMNVGIEITGAEGDFEGQIVKLTAL